MIPQFCGGRVKFKMGSQTIPNVRYHNSRWLSLEEARYTIEAHIPEGTIPKQVGGLR